MIGIKRDNECIYSQHEDECDLSRSMVREKGKVIEDDIPSLSLSFTPTMDEKKN